MKRIMKDLLLIILGVVPLLQTACTETKSYNLREIKEPEGLFISENIDSVMRQVLDYQLNNLPEECWMASKNDFEEIQGNGWIRSTFYAGVFAVFSSLNEQKYLDKLLAWGDSNDWKAAERPRHADDHCCIQTYTDLYKIKNDDRLLKHAIATFDAIADDPMLGSVVGRKNELNWSWCDALFMAPPAMAKLAAVTKDEKYLVTMDKMYWDTHDYLYDENEQLFYRDSRFKPDAEPLIKSDNGQPVFWSRGNGWVLAGLVRILQAMPDDYENKKKYEALFVQMSSKLIKLQDENGFWHSNLLDPASSPEPESSGTAFFCYGLAWGVNSGYLNENEFVPGIKKAWLALNRCLDENGQIKWVQLVGSAPAKVKYEDTVEYATGAFLLAASEVKKLFAN